MDSAGMGLILDSGVVIAAERRGESVRQMLENMRARYGEIDLGLSVITIAELTHGAYRANTQVHSQRRITFIDRVCADSRSTRLPPRSLAQSGGSKVSSPPAASCSALKT